MLSVLAAYAEVRRKQLWDPLHALYETTTQDAILKVRYGLFEEMLLFGIAQGHGIVDEGLFETVLSSGNGATNAYSTCWVGHLISWR